MNWKAILIALKILNISANLIYTQDYNVTGYLKSGLSGEPILFAYCYSTDHKLYTTSNENGFFHFKVSVEKIKLVFSHVSYLPDTILIELSKDTCLFIYLKELMLDEVRVMAEEINFVDQSISGKITVSQAVINKTPSAFGEPDLIKAISFLPGVSSGNKLFSNLYVRGGGRQNNVIFIDDAPTYNSNHLFGLLSVFNVDAIQHLDFYKSDFPARYGGATSSIVDIYTKDGNMTNYSGKLKVSLLYSKLLVEGPITKNNLSFLFAGRCSYFDLLMLPFYSLYKTSENISFPGYRFYDINSKITYKLSERKRLDLGIFHGNDRFSIFDKSQYSNRPYNNVTKNYFRNTSFSAQYKSDIFGKAYLRTSAVYSKYKNISESYWETKNTEDKQSMEEHYFGSVENIRIKTQIDFKPGINHSAKIGWKPAIYFIQPGHLTSIEKNNEEKTESVAGKEKSNLALENVFYIENDYTISSKFALNTGIRGIIFQHQSSIYTLEPRISLRYKTSMNSSLKVGYSIMHQFLHCITNNTQMTASEFWLLSGRYFPPERSYQYNTGLSFLLPFNIELTTDVYYKHGENVIYYNFFEGDPEFLEDYNTLLHRDGKTQGYGMEILVRKQSNRFQTLVAYTLSRSFIHFEELNENKKFPSQQDLLHDMSLVLLCNVNKINSLNLNFTYNSGAPVSLPVAYIRDAASYGGYYVYDGINNKRLPAFHRLDVSWVRTRMTKNNIKRDFYFNIYNVYAKQNAVYMFFANNKTYQTAVNLIIPSIGYVWHF